MGTYCVAQSFKFVLPSISDNDRRSFFQKRDAYSPSQSTGASGHQGKLPQISFTHCRLSFEEVDGPTLRSERLGKILGHAPAKNPPSARELSTAPCG